MTSRRSFLMGSACLGSVAAVRPAVAYRTSLQTYLLG